jgi:type III secretion protein D
MKVLRILTGVHAGARLALSEGRWRVLCLDPTSESWQNDEIALMDWHCEPLNLRVGPAGCVCLDAEGIEHPWVDFELRCFGDVVLCVGEDHAIWPSDATLLASLPLLSPMMSVPASLPIIGSGSMALQLLLRNVLVVAVVGMLLLPMVWVVFGPKNIQAAQTSATDAKAASLLTKLTHALQAEKLEGLEVRFAQGRFHIEGLVDDVLQDALARKTLQPFDRLLLVSAWQTASQLSDTMTTALNEPGVQVRHEGGGHFVAEGHAVQPDDVRVKVAKLKNDFSSSVRSLKVKVLIKARVQPKVAAMLEAGDLSYAVRPDGSKSFAARAAP